MIYQFFFADGISITQKAPASAKPGSEFTVELTIKKGDADGFAKLQQELPDGFEATEGTTSGSSFSFTDNKVKFIWMALPNDKEFKVSYKVKVDASIITGDKFIAGKFAYVVNNVKQQVEISPVTINISANPSTNPVAKNPTQDKAKPPVPDNLIAVSGTYLDDKDAPISGLKVYLKNDKGEVIETATTDSLGCFAFSKLSTDKNGIVGIDETDTHIIGRKSKANYKNAKGDVVLTKDLTGNAVAANTPPAPTKDTTPAATTSVTPPVITPTTTETPATTTTETPVAYAPPSVTNNPPATTTETPVATNVTAPTTTTETPVATNVNPSTTQPEVGKSTSTETNGLTCSRNVTQNGDDNSSYNVDITIDKGNVSGFAKYIEVLPAGFVAMAKESAGASFSFADGKVKYVWVSLPNTTSVKISYKITVANRVAGTSNIDGAFSYIENDETKKFALPTSTVNVSSGATNAPVATNITAPATNPDTQKTAVVTPPVTTTETPIATNAPVTTTETPVVTNATPPTTNVAPASTNVTAPTTTTETPATTATVAKTNPDIKTTELSATSIPNAQGDVAYSVQIAALHNPRTPENLAALYNIKDKVKTEMADGFTKYTVGSHKVYKEAHDARDLIKIKGVSDAWVTAYNKGKRITVQEALMITSQRWYK